MTQGKIAALILQGQGSYGALAAMNGELARQFALLGIEPVLLDLTQHEAATQRMNVVLRDFGPGRILAAFSYSGMGVTSGDNEPEGNVWQRLKIPVLSWMLDHPCYYLLRHSHPAPAVMRLYTCRDFMNFQRDYVRAPFRTALNRLGTLDYGHEAQPRQVRAGTAPLILVPKSGGDPAQAERKWQGLPQLTRRVIHGAIDHYWDTLPRSGGAEASVLYAADALGLELRHDLPLFCFLLAQVDDYLRRRKSDILVRSLLSLPVRIYGTGFDHIDRADARAQFMPPIDYMQMIELQRDALAVVSVNPNIDDDGHDRIYNAFGAGALPISDHNPWWRTFDVRLAPYSYDFRDRPATAAVEHILADPVAAASVAWEVGIKARAARSFTATISEAVEFALLHRQFTFNFSSPLEQYVRHGA